MKTPRINHLLEVARTLKAKALYSTGSSDATVPRGYNKLLPLDDLMFNVGNYINNQPTFEHRSSIKSLVYGISESHMSAGRKSPGFINQ